MRDVNIKHFQSKPLVRYKIYGKKYVLCTKSERFKKVELMKLGVSSLTDS